MTRISADRCKYWQRNDVAIPTRCLFVLPRAARRPLTPSWPCFVGLALRHADSVLQGNPTRELLVVSQKRCGPFVVAHPTFSKNYIDNPFFGHIFLAAFDKRTDRLTCKTCSRSQTM